MQKKTFTLVFSLFIFLNSGNLLSQAIEPVNFKYSQQVVDALKALEGYRDYVYFDNNSNPIFGYGHLVTERELPSLKQDFGYESLTGKESEPKKLNPPTNLLSQSEKDRVIEEYLRKDIDIVLAKMKKNIKIALEQKQIDALVIYLFWRGADEENEQVKQLYDFINTKNHIAVVDFIKNKAKKDQTYLPGNRRRNIKTAELYQTGEFPIIWY